MQVGRQKQKGIDRKQNSIQQITIKCNLYFLQFQIEQKNKFDLQSCLENNSAISIQLGSMHE
ncbi:hypothetical protein TTHERM_00425770 (macronuclear) [Tetrahymena thermophila SB210]|uniref:Uncharacterized protein n=1 Tax=Tetrahymena thermophila (strain SB210) TaxID=312017 RepID=Q23AI2_TETTS|nr:hypothetical protein TTHERM_00425770 [Tetrahymena thermophila SB210]EAR93510.1 hypothetical protein TTHERM_00425770 [Tetrahymena thermophila SB210]|eukprot:XP_001013755.1 hypothetical protein TTHERM_00425770 [Tetrahymena thermophila SB210]